MTIVVSNWGSGHNMGWLDGDTGCTDSCDNDPTIIISNMIVGKSDGPKPGVYACNDGGCAKSPTQGKFEKRNDCLMSCTSSYTFGNACASHDADLCTEECDKAHCKFSWPTNDPEKWNSKDAHCRC